MHHGEDFNRSKRSSDTPGLVVSSGNSSTPGGGGVGGGPVAANAGGVVSLGGGGGGPTVPLSSGGGGGQAAPASTVGGGVVSTGSGGGVGGGVTVTTSSHSACLAGGHQLPPSYETAESVLPREFRTRLHKLFGQIEREFEREFRKLYTENISLQERLEKYEDGEHVETNFLAKKLGASQISQKIKLQYKQSTSRLVSSLRPAQQAGGGWQLGCRMSGHRDGVWEVTAHRKLIASASADGTVRLWANGSGSCVLHYLGHTGSVNSVRFHEDMMLTAGGDGSVHLVRLSHDILALGGGCLGSGAGGNGPGGSGGTVLGPGTTTAGGTGETRGSIGVCGGPGMSGNTSSGVSGPSSALPTSTSGGNMVGQANNGGGGVGGGACAAGVGDQEDAVLNGEFEEESVTVLRHPFTVYEVGTPGGGGSIMESAAVSAADFLGGDQVVTGSWDRMGRIYDLATGALVQTLTGHENELTDVRCAPNGQKLALTSAKDATFRLWDFRSSGVEVHIQQGHSQGVSTAQFLGDHPEKLVSAGSDRLCKVWDLRQSRAPLLTIRTDAAINRLAVHPGGQILALPLDNRNVKFFDLAGNRLGRLPRSNSQGHSRMVTSVCWSEEGKNNFFSAAFDHQVLGWQIQFPMSN